MKVVPKAAGAIIPAIIPAPGYVAKADASNDSMRSSERDGVEPAGAGGPDDGLPSEEHMKAVGDKA